MKKSFVVLFCCLILPYASSAHYFNKYGQRSGYYTDHEFSLIRVKADRSMGNLDNEDRFWIKFKFTEDVENVEIEVKALDGTNDNDRREYSFKYSYILKDRIKEIYCGNLPTYVDNLVISIKYYVNDLYREITIYVYSTNKADQGSGSFAASSDGIPDRYVDSDGKGSWDSDSGFGTVGVSTLKFITAPYNLIKWLTNVDTLIALFLGIVTLKIGFVGLIYTRSFGFMVIIFVGGLLTVGTILEGFSTII